MLMMEPPKDRYMCDSARVENAGPSMQMMVPLSCMVTPLPASECPHLLMIFLVVLAPDIYIYI